MRGAAVPFYGTVPLKWDVQLSARVHVTRVHLHSCQPRIPKGSLCDEDVPKMEKHVLRVR